MSDTDAVVYTLIESLDDYIAERVGRLIDQRLDGCGASPSTAEREARERLHHNLVVLLEARP